MLFLDGDMVISTTIRKDVAGATIGLILVKNRGRAPFAYPYGSASFGKESEEQGKRPIRRNYDSFVASWGSHCFYLAGTMRRMTGEETGRDPKIPPGDIIHAHPGVCLSGKGLLSTSIGFSKKPRLRQFTLKKSRLPSGSRLFAFIAMGGPSIHRAGTVCLVPIYSVSFSDKPYRFASSIPYFSAKLNKTT